MQKEHGCLMFDVCMIKLHGYQHLYFKGSIVRFWQNHARSQNLGVNTWIISIINQSTISTIDITNWFWVLTDLPKINQQLDHFYSFFTFPLSLCCFDLFCIRRVMSWFGTVSFPHPFRLRNSRLGSICLWFGLMATNPRLHQVIFLKSIFDIATKLKNMVPNDLENFWTPTPDDLGSAGCCRSVITRSPSSIRCRDCRPVVSDPVLIVIKNIPWLKQRVAHLFISPKFGAHL